MTEDEEHKLGEILINLNRLIGMSRETRDVMSHDAKIIHFPTRDNHPKLKVRKEVRHDN